MLEHYTGMTTSNTDTLKRGLADLALLADEQDSKFVSAMCLLMIRFLDLPPKKQTLLMWMLTNLCDLVDADKS